MTAEQSTQLLVALLTLPASSLPSTLALPTIADSLSSLLAASRSTQHQQRTSDDTRQLLQAVIARAAPVKGALTSLSLVAHYLAAFLPLNAHLARATAHEALTANARLAQQVRTDGLDALKLALGRAGTPDDEHGNGAIDAATTLLALVQGTLECFSPQSTAGATAATDCLAALAGAYARLEADSAPALDSLRLAIVDTAHALVLTTSSALSTSSSAAHASSTALDCLKDLLVVLLPPRSSAAGPSALALDLASLAPGLAATLTDAVTGSVGPTARQVKDLVGGLRRAGEGAAGEAPDWVARLRRAQQVGGAADAGVGLGRDKGKEVALAGAISHLLDLFPHLPAPFLRAALVHPTFSSSGNLERATESLVASLLDDAPLPADLVALRDGAAPSPAPAPAPPAPTKPAPSHSPAPAAPARANVHDDDRLFSRGTLLGPRTARRSPPASARASSGGLALDESLKASIIALTEAPSSDEDDDDDAYGEAFLEGDEDGGPRVKVGDGEPKDGEGSSDEDGEHGGTRTPRGGFDGPQGGSTTASSSAPPARAAAPAQAAGYGPAVTLTLESAYLAHPEVFARDSATRRGKARKVLRERTGLGDEQIEGWKSMLERDAKKMQRLKDKHQDLAAGGNRPSAPSSSAHRAAGASSSATGAHERPPHQQQQQKQQEGSSAGDGAGGGRGGASGGRGGARGGGASRGRGDGGRKEHDRAKRGRDRKMARMGAAP
ncbi:uncharacterized protein RHOBADRAFT_53524 [Rhodotorula graminis WP1]|uniref:CUE domain-containing protein n=1 Tax=Rhodotorula graminis (strain WP1) TaxID=578459 RepID=A0A194S4A0_RHOGW|nr:uncharacterized protein RHOBADRAFT_53524 [Rhodotorula graminis WP1]KPV75558.1 hypothetical protein RHOBADRAFT_53524 [Rhodotorula graminis WP1]